MKKYLGLYISLGIFFLVLFFSCAHEKPGWQGTITEENGVTIVKNPKEPVYTENVFTLEEEMAWGQKTDSQDHFFASIRALQVDEAGNIYVLDPKDCQIKIFHKEGKFVQAVSRKGQGPGEIQLPLTMEISGGDTLVLYDMGKTCFSLFSLSGEFIRQKSAAEYLYLIRVRPDHSGHYIVQTPVRTPEKTEYQILLLDSDFELINEVVSIEEKRTPSGIISMLSPQVYYMVTREGHILFGYTKNYELQLLDQKGSLLKKIIKDYEPLPVTREVKERMIKERFEELGGLPEGYKTEFPDQYPPFRYFILDSEERIFVRTYEKSEDGDYIFDIFDPEGRYLGSRPLPDRPAVLKDGKLYTIEEDAEGYPLVKRYRFNWTI